MFCCFSTKAVTLLATTGYSTEAFLVAWRKFEALHSPPTLVVSDPGSQLSAAAKEVPLARYIDWGSKWLLTEPGCAWRNGQSERMVGLAKTTLSHHLKGDLSLDWSEFDSLLCEVANVINNRPLGVRSWSDDNIHAITPNDLLLARVPGDRCPREMMMRLMSSRFSPAMRSFWEGGGVSGIERSSPPFYLGRSGTPAKAIGM